MANTPAQDAASTYAAVTAKLAEVAADLAPNITVDGVTIDRGAYYRMLADMQKAALEAMQKAGGPFTVVSVGR